MLMLCEKEWLVLLMMARVVPAWLGWEIGGFCPHLGLDLVLRLACLFMSTSWCAFCLVLGWVLRIPRCRFVVPALKEIGWAMVESKMRLHVCRIGWLCPRYFAHWCLSGCLREWFRGVFILWWVGELQIAQPCWLPDDMPGLLRIAAVTKSSVMTPFAMPVT